MRNRLTAPTLVPMSSSSFAPSRLPDGTSDGAVVERLARMRAACQALALELAGTRRELKIVETELRRLKRRHGEHEHAAR